MALAWQDEAEQERSRRRLLDEADRVLDTVEELRLSDQRSVPPSLQHAIEALQLRLGRRPLTPATLGAAHRLVLALEGRLMLRNPRMAVTQRHEGRPLGQPLMKVLQGGLRWKVLTLPPAPPAGPDAAWLELLDATIERACDRWAYAQEQARRSARSRLHFEAAWARAKMAWANYWELSLEAENLRRRAESRRATI